MFWFFCFSVILSENRFALFGIMLEYRFEIPRLAVKSRA